MGGGIKEWPQDERPREKLLNQGAAGLTDAELLALIVRSGDPTTGQSAIDLGRNLIGLGSNLRELGNADIAELTAIKGMGLAKAAGVKAAFTLASRFQARKLERFDRFTSPQQVFDYFHHEYRARSISLHCFWMERIASSDAFRFPRAPSTKASSTPARYSTRPSRNPPPR